MSRHPKADIYRREREKGLTYRQIAEKYGVSFQCVASACGSQKGGSFRAWTEKTCVYPNLRNWLNENRITVKEFVRRMGNIPNGKTDGIVREYFKGKCYPQKGTIDRMLQVTGLTYEQLWARED